MYKIDRHVRNVKVQGSRRRGVVHGLIDKPVRFVSTYRTYRCFQFVFSPRDNRHAQFFHFYKPRIFHARRARMHSLVGSVSVDKYAFGVINSSLSSRANERKERKERNGEKEERKFTFFFEYRAPSIFASEKRKKKKRKEGRSSVPIGFEITVLRTHGERRYRLCPQCGFAGIFRNF